MSTKLVEDLAGSLAIAEYHSSFSASHSINIPL